MHKKNFGAKIIHFFKFSNIFTKKSKIYLCNPLQITGIAIRINFFKKRDAEILVFTDTKCTNERICLDSIFLPHRARLLQAIPAGSWHNITWVRRIPSVVYHWILCGWKSSEGAAPNRVLALFAKAHQTVQVPSAADLFDVQPSQSWIVRQAHQAKASHKETKSFVCSVISVFRINLCALAFNYPPTAFLLPSPLQREIRCW